MHSSLWLLTKLRLNASWRRFYRSMKTVRGALLGLFGVAFLAMTLLPAILGSRGARVPFSGLIEDYGPFFLLIYTLFILMSSVGEQAIYFSPSEVDFLFPAPFTRRQLLVYKLSTSVLSTVALSLFLAVVNRMQYRNSIAGLLGFFLTFSFLQLVSMFTGLLGQVVSARAFTRSRRLVGIAIIAAIAFAMSQALSEWDGANLWEIPKLVDSTIIGRILLAPFRVFCDAITAEHLVPDFIRPAVIGTLMIAGLVLGIFALDADFSDVAIRVSQQRLQRAKKMQQGDFSWSRKSTNKSSTSIGMLPYWQGSGPIIWRQLIRMLRQSKMAIRIGLVILLAASIPIYRKLGSMELSPHTPLFVLGWLGYFTVLFAGSLPLGFRVDIDRMEVLKNLPVSPTSIVAGQVGAPVLLMTILHWSCILLGSIFVPVGWSYWGLGALLSPMFNCLLICLSQGLFLLFPIRLTDGAQDPQAALKNMLITMLQFLAYAIVLLITAVPSLIVYYLTKNLAATVVVGALLLLGADLAALLFVRICYVRFDVTKHAPT